MSSPRKAKRPKRKAFGERFPTRKSAAAPILATNVRRLRKTRKLSQKELATAACVSAWGPGADQHSNRLIDFISMGSML
jgi:DNA-binding transcriptional regulator YiaG